MKKIYKVILFICCLIFVSSFNVAAQQDDVLLYDETMFDHYDYLIVSQDGVFIVGMSNSLGQISFYENGVLNKRHYVSDLVLDLSAKTHFNDYIPPVWEQAERRMFNPANNVLSITTVDYMEYRFDIRTGEIFWYRHVPMPTDGRPQFNISPGQGFTIGIALIFASILVIVFLYFLESW